jgi:PAS domain S-box-containing protein
MADMAWTALPDGTIDFINDRAKSFSGNRPGNADALLQAMHPDDRQLMMDGWQASLARGESYECEVRGRRRDGVYRWFRIRIVPVLDASGAIDHWFGTATDIHETHEAEAALRTAQAQTDSILGAVSDGFLNLDREWRVTYANPAAQHLLRRPADELLNRVAWDTFPGALDTFSPHYARAMETGENIEFIEYFEPLGTWFEVRAYPHAEGISVYFRDVTERMCRETALAHKQAELEAALAKLQRLLDHSVDAICTFTADGTCVEMSPSSANIWGYGPDEMVGRQFGDFIHPGDREASARSNAEIRAGRQVRTMLQRNVRKDGSTVHIQWSSFWSPEDQLFFNIARDVTELVEAEARLRQSQRLETLGQLTGGIAHDFNNLLTVILGNAEFLADQLAHESDLHRLAVAMQNAAERGSALNRRLLAFARKQALDPKITDINALVGSMDHLLRRTLGEHVEIEIVRAGGLWRGHVDPAQLESAILNLCLNARDAMPNGGRLTIETANAYLDGTYAANHEDVQPGQYVMVAVTDTGEGMTPEVISRAFEPFFTTKDVGRGSGLGLSMVYGFVKQSGGHIKIYSEVGHGTVIRIYVPRTSDHAAETPVRAKPSQSFAGTEKILLVEDDDMVRRHVEKQLAGLGYRVVAAANGPEALEVLHQVADFDLLFTDVVMPRGMNGQQLAEKARQLRPGLPVLFTSGYSENAIIHHGRLDPGVHLLNKPYRREEMARKVREVLDMARAERIH